MEMDFRILVSLQNCFKREFLLLIVGRIGELEEIGISKSEIDGLRIE
tara:strand:- start:2903 stop:3043 length:141 start_codon:yes stop_codon:yes gene_type:complete